MTLDDLKTRLKSGKIFHAYIVTGGSGASRLAAGQLIARAAVCQGALPPCGACRGCVKALHGVHPDIEVVEKTGREHTVDAMRALRGRAVVLPNEAPRSVFIINDADAMNTQAQNAMLKVFEEPPAHAVFLLLAENPQRLLETVRSRCETVIVPPEEGQENGDIANLAGLLVSAFAKGNDLSVAELAPSIDKLSREDMPEFIASLRREALRNAGRLGQERLERLISAADMADKMTNVNVSAVHIAALLEARLIDGGKSKNG